MCGLYNAFWRACFPQNWSHYLIQDCIGWQLLRQATSNVNQGWALNKKQAKALTYKSNVHLYTMHPARKGVGSQSTFPPSPSPPSLVMGMVGGHVIMGSYIWNRSSPDTDGSDLSCFRQFYRSKCQVNALANCFLHSECNLACPSPAWTQNDIVINFLPLPKPIPDDLGLRYAFAVSIHLSVPSIWWLAEAEASNIFCGRHSYSSHIGLNADGADECQLIKSTSAFRGKR